MSGAGLIAAWLVVGSVTLDAEPAALAERVASRLLDRGHTLSPAGARRLVVGASEAGCWFELDGGARARVRGATPRIAELALMQRLEIALGAPAPPPDDAVTVDVPPTLRDKWRGAIALAVVQAGLPATDHAGARRLCLRAAPSGPRLASGGRCDVRVTPATRDADLVDAVRRALGTPPPTASQPAQKLVPEASASRADRRDRRRTAAGPTEAPADGGPGASEPPGTRAPRADGQTSPDAPPASSDTPRTGDRGEARPRTRPPALSRTGRASSGPPARAEVQARPDTGPARGRAATTTGRARERRAAASPPAGDQGSEAGAPTSLEAPRDRRTTSSPRRAAADTDTAAREAASAGAAPPSGDAPKDPSTGSADRADAPTKPPPANGAPRPGPQTASAARPRDRRGPVDPPPDPVPGGGAQPRPNEAPSPAPADATAPSASSEAPTAPEAPLDLSAAVRAAAFGVGRAQGLDLGGAIGGQLRLGAWGLRADLGVYAADEPDLSAVEIQAALGPTWRLVLTERLDLQLALRLGALLHRYDYQGEAGLRADFVLDAPVDVAFRIAGPLALEASAVVGTTFRDREHRLAGDLLWARSAWRLAASLGLRVDL